MNGASLREACRIAVPLDLAQNLVFPVVPISGLAALKILAWGDRRDRRDAHDLQLLARSYLDAGNRDRLYDEHTDLIDDDFDYVLAGAKLLGRDIRILGEGEPIEVDYRLRDRNGGWYVIDVIIEGVSLLSNFRSQTQEVISQEGPDALIRKLREKNEEREAETAAAS